nr:unnamed protein product [Callosobruchus chinensis]
MHQFSDSDSDSDKGIRYKTVSTRNKIKHDTDTARSLDQQHSRDRRHERHRRHSKDRYKRRRSRSHSRDNKHDRYKKKSEKKSCTRDRSPVQTRGNLADSDNHSYNKTTGRQRKSSLDNKKADEFCKNENSDTKKSRDNRDTKPRNEVKGSLQKSKVITKDSYNDVRDINKDKSIDSRENMFGPSLPPHLQKESSSVPKESRTAQMENVEENRIGSVPLIKPTSQSSLIENDRINEELLPNPSDSTADIALPQSSNICGPALPNNLEKKTILNLDSEQPEKLKESCIGKSADVVSQLEEPLSPQLLDNDLNNCSVSNAIDYESNTAIIGPALPPHLQKKELLQSEKESESIIPCIEQGKEMSNNIVIGPALPPHLQKNLETKQDDSGVVGPALPQHLEKEVGEQAKIIGPSLPPHLRQHLGASQTNTQNEARKRRK